MEYKGLLGERFQLLFIDPQTLRNIASKNDFECEIVKEEKNGDFLAKIY